MLRIPGRTIVPCSGLLTLLPSRKTDSGFTEVSGTETRKHCTFFYIGTGKVMKERKFPYSYIRVGRKRRFLSATKVTAENAKSRLPAILEVRSK